MTTRLSAILQLHDAGQSAQEIATVEKVSPGYVYGVLRRERPERTRKPRTRTSERRRMILGLTAQGIRVARVAFLCSCSAAYVYKVTGEVAVVRQS